MRLIAVQLGVHSHLQIRQTWVMAVHQNHGKCLLSFGWFSCAARKAGQFGWDPLWFGLITHIDAETYMLRLSTVDIEDTALWSSVATHQLWQLLLFQKSVFIWFQYCVISVFTPLCIYPRSVAVIHKSSIILFTFFLTFLLPNAALALLLPDGWITRLKCPLHAGTSHELFLKQT